MKIKIILNLAGLVIFLLGFGMFAVLDTLTDNANIAGVAAGLTITIIDVVYRATRDGKWTKFLSPFIGGFIFYIPIWIWGIFLAFLWLKYKA